VVNITILTYPNLAASVAANLAKAIDDEALVGTFASVATVSKPDRPTITITVIPAPSMPPATCDEENNGGYRDAANYTCKEWEGFDCHYNYAAEYKVDANVDELEEVRINCPLCCGLSPPPPALPPAPPPAPPPPSPPPRPISPDSCATENLGFKDAMDYSCQSWETWDCYYNYGGEYIVTSIVDQLQEVRTNCPLCCGFVPPPPPAPPPLTCAAEDSRFKDVWGYTFKDVWGYSCSDWEGFTCHETFGGAYNASTLQDVRTHCPACCSVLPAPPPMPPGTCQSEDESDFTDSFGYSCGDWVGYDCYMPYYVTDYPIGSDPEAALAAVPGSYTEAALAAVRSNCRVCCGFQPPPPSPPPPPASCAREKDNGFTDSFGYSCGYWVGYDCYLQYYVTEYPIGSDTEAALAAVPGSYTEAALEEVRANCRMCCGLTPPPPSPPAPAASCAREAAWRDTDGNPWSDAAGFSCYDWQGYDCTYTDYTNSKGELLYTAGQLQDVRSSCPACCGLST